MFANAKIWKGRPYTHPNGHHSKGNWDQRAGLSGDSCCYMRTCNSPQWRMGTWVLKLHLSSSDNSLWHCAKCWVDPISSTLHSRHGHKCHWASLVAQTIKNLPAMEKTWVQFLGREDPLEKRMATHPCLENSMDWGAWSATVCKAAKGQDTAKLLTLSLHFTENWGSERWGGSIRIQRKPFSFQSLCSLRNAVSALWVLLKHSLPACLPPSGVLDAGTQGPPHPGDLGRLQYCWEQAGLGQTLIFWVLAKLVPRSMVVRSSQGSSARQPESSLTLPLWTGRPQPLCTSAFPSLKLKEEG